MCMIAPVDLTDGEREEPLEVKFNLEAPHDPFPNLNKYTMIPTNVVRDIIMVYEFGDETTMHKLPDNLICMRGGSFWTTWDFVISLRKQMEAISVSRHETEGDSK